MTVWAVCIVVVLAWSGAGCAKLSDAPSPSASPSRQAELTRRLDAGMAKAMSEFHIPGAVVSISVPGKINYVKAFGTSDRATGVPMSLDDHIRIGSVTKTFTGTAVLQLVDRKRVQLSDPISKYVDGVPSRDKITLQMLGQMRSGLFNYDEDEEFAKSVLTEVPKGRSAGAFTARQLLDVAFKHPLNFKPGTKYEYSNTNIVLLGMVVEKVSGQPLATYFQQNIFAPLNMTHTSYPSSGQMPAPYAHGETMQTLDGKVADATLWNPAWANAAGAIISSYPDMKIWADALGKGSLLTPQTQQRRLQAKQIVPGWNYGFTIFDLNGWIGHSGSIFGYTTVVLFLPGENATLVALATSDILKDGEAPAGQLAKVATTIVTPDHLYSIAQAAPKPDSPAPSKTR
jgi:D-alanyl-D-alanine carboxypeptidase